MSILIIFYQFLSCKPNSPPTSSPIQIPDDSEDEVLQWTAENTNEELGFALLKHDGIVYATAPASTQGRLYQLTSDGLVLVQEHLGRYGHQLFSFSERVYVQSPHLEKILDLDMEALYSQPVGKVVGDQNHWYTVRDNALYVDGIVDTEFTQTPFDIAVCGEQIGISFPFSNAHRVWISGSWYFPAQDDSIRPFLHCHDIDQDGDTEWFLGGDHSIEILDNESYRSLSSDHFSFGQSIVFGDSNQDGQDEMWISAPDSRQNNATGWVGAFHWPEDSPFAQWTGQTPHERFGYSLLFEGNSVLVGVPNATYSYVKRITWIQE